MTAYTDEEIDEEKAALDALKEDVEEVEPEVVTVIVEQIVQRDEKNEKPRKKQHRLTILISAALIGIVIFLFINLIEKCQKDRVKRKERADNLQEMITVKPIPGVDGKSDTVKYDKVESQNSMDFENT